LARRRARAGEPEGEAEAAAEVGGAA